MARIAIEIPEELCQFLEAKVQQGKFANASEYLVSLLNSARDESSVLERALLVGIESGPAEEWNSADWDDMKRRVARRCQGS